jgi:hypothetical protein
VCIYHLRCQSARHAAFPKEGKITQGACWGRRLSKLKRRSLTTRRDMQLSIQRMHTPSERARPFLFGVSTSTMSTSSTKAIKRQHTVENSLRAGISYKSLGLAYTRTYIYQRPSQQYFNNNRPWHLIHISDAARSERIRKTSCSPSERCVFQLCCDTHSQKEQKS